MGSFKTIIDHLYYTQGVAKFFAKTFSLVVCKIQRVSHFMYAYIKWDRKYFFLIFIYVLSLGEIDYNQ